MERYAQRENIALYQRLLAEVNVTKDQVRHAELTRLLAAEGLLRPLPPKRAGRAPVAGCAKVGEVYARRDVS